jgi:hypothetical protein
MKSINRSAAAVFIALAAFAAQAGDLALQVGVVRTAEISGGVQHVKLATKASLEAPETVVSITQHAPPHGQLASGDVVLLMESNDSKVWILPMSKVSGTSEARN